MTKFLYRGQRRGKPRPGWTYRAARRNAALHKRSIARHEEFKTARKEWEREKVAYGFKRGDGIIHRFMRFLGLRQRAVG